MLVQRLRYLIALARERHFARAAIACRVKQPTLSAGIKQLEDELGVPIVERGQRYQGLTQAGEKVLAWAHRIIADYDWLSQEIGEMRDGLVGRLSFGAIPAAHPVVPLLTTALLDSHPNVTVTVRSLTSLEIQRGLDDYSVDVGLTYLDNEALPSVRTQPLYRERYLLVTHADGPFGDRDEVTWREASELPLCLLDASMQNRRILDGIFQAAGAEPSARVETTSLLTVCAHVRLGRWSTILPHTFRPLVSALAGVRLVPLIEPTVEHSVGLVVADREPLPPLARALLALAKGADVDAWLNAASSRPASADQITTRASPVAGSLG
jgi:DNA-binding transcriptional LysR family regulator